MEKHKKILTEAYEEYSQAIFRYCFFKISDREKALDFVSETFTRTWQYMLKGNDIENMKTFLYTTASHIIIDEYRKKKSISLDALMDSGNEPQGETKEALYTAFDIARVMKKMLKLPKNDNAILGMRYIEDLSIQEIATKLNESENTVSVRIHRGLGKLKKLIT